MQATAPLAPLRTRLLAGTTWNLIAMVFNQGSTFAVNIVVARILGRLVFGEYAMVQTTLLTAAGCAQLAMGYTATKYVAEFRAIDKEKTGNILGLCGVVTLCMAITVALVLALSAPYIARTGLKAPHLTVPLMIGSGFLLFAAINGYQTGVLAGLEGFPKLARAGVLSGLTAMIGIVIGARVAGLYGAIMGLTLTAILRCSYHNVYLRSELKAQGLSIRFDHLASVKPILTRFAVPAAIQGYILLPAIWLANSVLVRQNHGYEQMALYAAATNIRVLMLFVPNVVNNVGTVALNHAKGAGDPALYKRIHLINFACVLGIVIALILLMLLTGRWVLGIFGGGFRAGHAVLVVLVASTLPESLQIAMYQRLQAQGRMWLSLFAVVLPWYATFVVCAYILAPAHGAVGLATAYFLGCTVACIGVSIAVASIRKSEVFEPGAHAVVAGLETQAIED